MQRASRTLLLAILVVPLVFTTGGIDPAFAVRLLLLAALTVALLWSARSRSVPVTLLTISWALSVLLAAISIAFAKNSGEAVYGVASVLLYFVFFLAARAAINVDGIRPIARVCTVLAMIVAIVGLAQFYDIGFLWVPGGQLPAGTMTTRNLLSSFLFLLLPFILYTGLTDDRRWQIVSLAALVALTLTILIAQTRAVWLAAIVFCVLGSLGTWLFARERRLLVRSVPMLGIFVLCFAYVTAFHVSSRRITDEPKPGAHVRPVMSYNPSDTSAAMRLNVWKASFRMIGEHPLGVGAGNWKIALPAHGLAQYPKYVQDGTYQWTHSHNDFIEQTAELGVLGGIAYLSIFIFGVFAAIRAARASTDSNQRLLFILLGACVIGFGIISLLDFPKTRVEHMMLFMILLATLDKFGGHEFTSLKSSPIILSALAIPALFFAGLHFIAETHEHNIVELRQEQDWPAVVEECNKTYNPKLLSLDELSTPVLYYRAEAEFMQNDLNSALRDNLAALTAHPNHIYTLNNTGSCYTKLSNFDSARVFYLRALAISPNFEESLLNITAVYFNLHDYANAMKYVSRCDTTVAGSRAQTIARMVRAKLY